MANPERVYVVVDNNQQSVLGLLAEQDGHLLVRTDGAWVPLDSSTASPFYHKSTYQPDVLVVDQVISKFDANPQTTVNDLTRLDLNNNG